jgi:hypothetical protein
MPDTRSLVANTLLHRDNLYLIHVLYQDNLFKANASIILQQFVVAIVPAGGVHSIKLRQCVPFADIIYGLHAPHNRLALERSGKDSPGVFALLSFICVREIFFNKFSWFNDSYFKKS